MTKPMNKIEKLIAELCPDGVEFKELWQLGEFYGGLSGKSKDDFSNGNAKFVTYMNIYSNIAINTNIDVFVKLGNGEKQNRIEYGDVLFTGSSETPDECGMSSVLTRQTEEPLYLNSFCFGFRFNDTNLFLPEFSKYLFRDEQIRKQIAKTVSGVTRFNVSKKRFAKIKIPVPPLAIQQEIVKILDTFTKLEAELEAELEARKKQYEYYRKELLTFGEDVEWKTLGEVCKVLRGKRLTKKELSNQYQYPVFHGGLIPLGYYDKYNRKANQTMVINTGSVGEVVWSNVDFWSSDGTFTIETSNGIDNKFIYFFLKCKETYLKSQKREGGVPTIDREAIEKIKIPVPPLAEQERIVAILDKFDALVNDISVGLPAELNARRKQYEYYREKLLTFKEKIGMIKNDK